ncbi:MAG: potassium channel family protein [Planctomycetes bacterium]|nr:potassium channel family protein [Planctomycetota bacterium]
MKKPADAVAHRDPLHHELRPYQLFMFGLGVYVLLSLAVQTLIGVSPSTDAILDQIDQVICCVFFIDFWVNLYTAHDRLAYLKWGWIDLLSSLPMVDLARAGRLARMIRVFRALRGVRSARFLANYLLHRRADSAFFALALLSVLLILFSSIAILQFETANRSNIRTPEDAVWWAFTTITTVGYGDKYPVTTEGRMIAAVLMTAGVGIFGSFTGLMASWILNPSKKERQQDRDLALLHQQVAEIQRHVQGTCRHAPAAPADADFQDVCSAWPELSESARTRILAEIRDSQRKAA